MPNIQSAKKKVRKDAKRTAANKTYREGVKKTLKKAVKAPNKKDLSKAFSTIDKAAKRKVMHKNKASRLKSRISKLLFGKKK